LVILGFAPLSTAAEILRWVDENGVVHFTDAFKTPEKYRSGAEQIEAEPAVAPDRVSAPLQIRGHIAVVQALLNNGAYANLVVDTGSTLTVISHAVARDLGIDVEGGDFPRASFQTVNGVVSAPVVTLESIQISGMEVRGLRASVHDISPEVSGLLGMNFLSLFRMDIDHSNSLLHLERK
jgi:clan AA aspartic protease (TIGR02281 family)